MNMDALYQDMILDHYKNPRNFQKLDDVGDDHIHENPSCGDSLKLKVEVKDGVVVSVFHESHGCAISVSSASMMSELLTGKTVEEARGLIELFLSVMRSEKDPAVLEEFDDLSAFEGVIKFPLRVKCASLSWHAAEEVLKSLTA